MELARRHSTLFGAIVLGTVGATWLLCRKFSSLVYTKRITSLINLDDPKVFVVTKAKEWAHVETQIISESRILRSVGFDCEWVQVQKSRRPVALLQLASPLGTCVLIRLTLLTSIPVTLKNFLEDANIMKVGVACLTDAAYLLRDHGIQVNGCIDVRHLAVGVVGKGQSTTLGLKGLTATFLGRELDKDWHIRVSDWEAKKLSDKQIKYAALDSLVGVQLLLALYLKLQHSVPTANMLATVEEDYKQLGAELCRLCKPFVDVEFLQKNSSVQTGGVNDCSKSSVRKRVIVPKRAYSSSGVAKGPHYHNCILLAPDGQKLSTVDPDKVFWYEKKGLGRIVSHDPLTMQLNFEPAGRPQMEEADGQYYLQERENVCAVCGSHQSYLRKNVVPKEYRRHFPDILKSHVSHDVVLLCSQCHQSSNILDNDLRERLAEEFNATAYDVGKMSFDGCLRRVKTAASALKRHKLEMSEERVKELEQLIMDHFGVLTLTEEVLQKAAEIEPNLVVGGFEPHGVKVVRAYKRVGLVLLEQRWRQNFLDTMQPKFLPDCWSINHNVKKMHAKAARLHADDPLRKDYRVALVGTEGTLDVPYGPYFGQLMDVESRVSVDFEEQRNPV